MDLAAPAKTRKRSLTWQDFPAGFAENSHPRLFNLALGWGELFDCGMHDYGEFFANLEYAHHLLNGGMTSVNGRPGTLIVANRYLNAIQLRWRFSDIDVVGSPETICPWGQV